MIINLDQTPLSYISTRKYTFNIKGAKNLPVKEIDDKHQNTATFAVSIGGRFLLMQLIYTGNTKRCLPIFDFPHAFNVTFTKNHWFNMEKAVEDFENSHFSIHLENQRQTLLPQRANVFSYYHGPFLRSR